jgi:uncharacterized alpha-E superfamily protein
MPANHPAACRRSAERCRRRAEAAKDEVGKVTWLKFAEEWLKLADEAEQSAGHHDRQLHHVPARARRIAGLSGFLTLIQSRDGPDR